ncbi:MAG: hypothetical protein HUU55_23000 [Myxococcales bacterium]|nr:hypothetical protein [Myxococcales bacterium]
MNQTEKSKLVRLLFFIVLVVLLFGALRFLFAVLAKVFYVAVTLGLAIVLALLIIGVVRRGGKSS